MMYKQTISIEIQLQKIVNENPEYGELWSTWNLNKKTLEPILSAIIKDYPHYSFHDYSHSESILLNIERLLGNENIEKLSPTDLWLLLHVSYLHDFGMVILDSRIHDFWSSSNFQHFLKEQADSSDEDIKKAANAILCFDKIAENYDVSWPLNVKAAVTLLVSSYCRWQHANFSRHYILDINNIWGIDLGHNGLIKKRLVSLLADISAMHTMQFGEVFTLHKEANGFKNDYVHPRLVACLLRLGDVLDLDNGRFNQYGEIIFGKMPENSKTHFEKHEATKHVLITNELIEVEADCPTDNIFRETRKWFDSLKSEIEHLHLNWNDIAPKEFGYPPKLAPYKILRNGIEDSYELSSLKFSITQNKAFEILEGSSIYKDKFSCIREIVQNAEDASKIQLWRDIQSGMYYANAIDESKVKDGSLLPNDIPAWIYQTYAMQITVEKNEKNNAVVSVMDHGTGISLETLKSICNVGQSYFQKEKNKREIEEMPVWLRPTANFGVGLQSCFMATDKIIIYTNSNEGDSYKLTFKSGKQEGYVNVESSQSILPRGSRVVIELENGMDFSYSMWGFTEKQLQKIEPFESNCVVMYKVIESIFNECGKSFFDINIISESMKFQDKISSYLMNEEMVFPNQLFKGDLLYSLSENKASITCWYNNNLYKVTLSKNSRGDVNVKFKGKRVHKTKIYAYGYVGFLIDVDIYGIATKEALSLNREELKDSASRRISEDINYIIGNYFDILMSEIESIQENTSLVDAWMLSSWLYDKEFPTSLHNYVSEQKDIRILEYDDSERKYKVENCSLRELVGLYPQLPYIDCEIVPDKTRTIHSLTEGEAIELLKDSNVDTNHNVKLLIDEDLKRYLTLCYCDITYLRCRKNLCICVVRMDDGLYVPDEYTRNRFIQQLVYKEIQSKYTNSWHVMRRSVPAFQEFSNLAVDMKEIHFVGREHFGKWNIISPISMEDSAKIEELSKEAFAEYITNKETFNNLVCYVCEHGKTKCSKQTVVDDYKRLIEVYYAQVKE